MGFCRRLRARLPGGPWPVCTEEQLPLRKASRPSLSGEVSGVPGTGVVLETEPLRRRVREQRCLPWPFPWHSSQPQPRPSSIPVQGRLRSQGTPGSPWGSHRIVGVWAPSPSREVGGWDHDEEHYKGQATKGTCVS